MRHEYAHGNGRAKHLLLLLCTHASYSIKTVAVKEYIQKVLDEQTQLNANTLMDDALRETWMQMTTKEKEGFYKRYLQTLKPVIDESGNIRLLIDG